MKMSAEESAEYPDTVMASRPAYPWGLCITLDDDSLKKLGMKLPELDQVIEFKIKAQVTGVNAYKRGDEDDESSASLQITEMEVVDSGGDAAKKLYKEMK